MTCETLAMGLFFLWGLFCVWLHDAIVSPRLRDR